MGNISEQKKLDFHNAMKEAVAELDVVKWHKYQAELEATYAKIEAVTSIPKRLLLPDNQEMKAVKMGNEDNETLVLPSGFSAIGDRRDGTIKVMDTRILASEDFSFADGRIKEIETKGGGGNPASEQIFSALSAMRHQAESPNLRMVNTEYESESPGDPE